MDELGEKNGSSGRLYLYLHLTGLRSMVRFFWDLSVSERTGLVDDYSVHCSYMFCLDPGYEHCYGIG